MCSYCAFIYLSGYLASTALCFQTTSSRSTHENPTQRLFSAAIPVVQDSWLLNTILNNVVLLILSKKAVNGCSHTLRWFICAVHNLCMSTHEHKVWKICSLYWMVDMIRTNDKAFLRKHIPKCICWDEAHDGSNVGPHLQCFPFWSSELV